MAHTPISLILVSFTSLLFFLTPQIHAQPPPAPAPSTPGPISIKAILVKGGQFNTFIRLLTITQVGDQIDNQVNNSNQGMTVFAPTDNAFSNLRAGTINSLTTQQQVQLVLYHVLPHYYKLTELLTVVNPVRTQATGQDGSVFGLYFSGKGNQVNVSSGIVQTQVNNALRQDFPLAVYQVDKVLLPRELTVAMGPAPASPAANTTSGGSGSRATKSTTAEPAPAPAPPTINPTPGGFSPTKSTTAEPALAPIRPAANTTSGGSSATKSTAAEPAPASDSGRLEMELGLVAGLGLFWLGLLS